MALTITELDATWQPDVLAFLRRSPYRNAIPLSNVTQLRQRCAVVLAHSQGRVQGVISHDRDLPFPGLSFAVAFDEALPPLLGALGERLPALRGQLLTTVAPEQRARQLARFTRVEALAPEYQMVVEPETLRLRAAPGVRRLRHADLPAMHALAVQGGLMAWRPEALDLGPAFGAFDGERLLAMATTRFATSDVVEIGNIVTCPDHRRRGLASACVSALVQTCFTLTPRVYLLVMADNAAAFAACRALGFWPAERFACVRFWLR